MKPIIALKGAEKRFGKKIIFSDFDLTIGEGEFVAICGASGSGKTTLLNIIGLLDSLDGGDLLVGDYRNPKANSSKAQKIIREEIGYVFQSFALVDSMTVEKNLLMAMHYVRSSTEKKKAAVSSALNSVGMKGSEGSKVYELSGGEQQRVSLARCLVKPVRLLLADEPTGSLDGDNRDMVMNLLVEMNRSGRTVIVVTHDQYVARYCSRKVLIK